MPSNLTVATEADWAAAAQTIDAIGFGSGFGALLTVTLAAPTGTLALTADPAAIAAPNFTAVTIIGNGQTIDGGGVARGLFLHSGIYGGGSLTLRDLTIANTVAAGGDGGPGGGGGAGLGGGLFVGANAHVVLDGVTFINDQAIGGAGGTGVLGGGGGLGGDGGAGDLATGAGGGGGGLGRSARGGDAGLPGGKGLLPAVFGTPAASGTAKPGSNYGGGGGGLGAGNPGGHGGAGSLFGAIYGGAGGGAHAAPALISLGNYAGMGGGGGSGLASAGGFGGGGGGAYANTPAGLGGFGAGNGGSEQPGGGGGLGAGGAIFVGAGGQLTITGGTITATGAVGGPGGGSGTAGSGMGGAIFLQSTMMQNGTVGLAAAQLTLAPAAGKRVSITGAIADDAGALLAGGGAAAGAHVIVSGAGTVELRSASTYAGGTTINGGTLELGTAQSAGGGAIDFTPVQSTLLIDGAVPRNTISHFGPSNTIDLAGVVAPSGTAHLDGNHMLTVGTATLRFDSLTALAGGTFTLAPDGHGGTQVTTNKAAILQVVTVTGAAGGQFAVPFTNVVNAAAAQFYVDPVNLAIANRQAVRFTADGSPLPVVPVGQSLVLYHTAPVPVTLPDAVPSALFSETGQVATLTGGAANGELIVVGNDGLDFRAGLGQFNLFAGDGDDTISIAPGAAGGMFHLGDGSVSVNAVGGNNIIVAGNGNHVFTFGIGANTADAAGNNIVMGGPGNVTFNNRGSGQDLVLMGSGNNAYSTGGTATVASASGNDNIFLGGLTNAYFAGSGEDTFHGSGTVVGGSGVLWLFSQASYYTPDANLLLFAGSGTTNATIFPGAATVVGNPAGTLVLDDLGSSALVFATGATTVHGAFMGGIDAAKGTIGADTVLGIGGTLTVDRGQGVFLAPPGGNSHINVFGHSTVFGSAAGDVLSTSDIYYGLPELGATTAVLVGGAGAETISGAGSTVNNVFYAGSGPEFIQCGDWTTSIVTSGAAATIAGGHGISLTAFVNGRHPDVVMQNFDPARDYLTFMNFAAGEAAVALAGAQTVAGSEVLTLSDGTHITFQGFTGLAAGNIL